MTIRTAGLALCSFAVVLTGCPPPSASVLIQANEEAPRIIEVEKRGPTTYFVRAAYTPDSLNARQNSIHPFREVHRVNVALRDGATLTGRSVEVRPDSLFLFRSGEPAAGMELPEVRWLVLRDRHSGRERLETAGYTALGFVVLALLLPKGNRSNVGEALTSAGIGAAVSLPFGWLFGSGDQAREVVHVTGYEPYTPTYR